MSRGEPLLSLVHPDDREMFREATALPGVLESGFDVELRVIRRDGEIRWIHNRGFAVRDPNGDVYRLAGVAEDVTEENIQARIRGTLLMALSNKFGWLVLAPGNKSEMSVGYATLYGDMAGGFAVLKDVPKTTVYDLARLRADRGPSIPESTIAIAGIF